MPYKQGVTGSSPVVPTKMWPGSSVGLECQPVTLEVEGSSPFRVAISALVAQSVEHVTENHSVGGSIPPQGTTVCGSSSVGRAPPCQGGGRESEPRLPLHFFRRHSQVVRRRSAKPLFSGPNPDGASKETHQRKLMRFSVRGEEETCTFQERRRGNNLPPPVSSRRRRAERPQSRLPGR